MHLLFRKWWVVLLQGVLLIVLSIYIFQNPAAVLTGISFWFGVMVLATGLLGIVSWVTADESEREGTSLVWSIVTVAFGLLMLVNRSATMKTMTVLLGVWMLGTGEHRPYDRRVGYARRVMPEGRWGAWEVFGRYSHVDLDDQLVAGGVMDKAALGLNWWATRRWKIGVDYGRTGLNRDRVHGVTNAFHTRFQWVYS